MYKKVTTRSIYIIFIKNLTSFVIYWNIRIEVLIHLALVGQCPPIRVANVKPVAKHETV